MKIQKDNRMPLFANATNDANRSQVNNDNGI